MALQVATKVRACVKTSSPRSTPTNSMAICNALVPLTHTTAFLVPVKSVIISSKRSTIFHKDGFSKTEIVDVMKRFLPNFEHEEKGKNLDQKM